jgi:CheY-like chemotaxis protein
MSQFLSLQGYRVLTAQDGFEALRLLTQQEIDLLLADIVMPGLDGVELARTAKALRPQMLVIFLTGYSVKESEAILMLLLTLTLAVASAACQGGPAPQRTASMPSTHLGAVVTPESCPYDDGGFGAPFGISAI